MVAGITKQTLVVLLVCSDRRSWHGYLVIIFFIVLSTVLGIHSSPQHKVNVIANVGNRSGLRMTITLASANYRPFNHLQCDWVEVSVRKHAAQLFHECTFSFPP